MEFKLDVFLSSHQKEFQKTRVKLSKIISRMPFLECIPLESRGAADGDVRTISLKAARKCDIFIGIFGDKYSRITADEYYEAAKHRKRCLFYVKKSKQRSDELTEFIVQELKIHFKYHEFKKSKDLQSQVKRDLTHLLFDTLKAGMEAIKKEKAKAKNIESYVAKSATKLVKPKDRSKLMFSQAQEAYNKGMYLQSVVTSATTIELSLREALLNAGLKKEELLSYRYLFNFALKYELINKRELELLIKLQHVRNKIVHEGTIPSKETAGWALHITKRILISLIAHQNK